VVESKTTVHFCQATSSPVASSMCWHHPSVCSRSSILVCCPDISLDWCIKYCIWATAFNLQFCVFQWSSVGCNVISSYACGRVVMRMLRVQVKMPASVILRCCSMLHSISHMISIQCRVEALTSRVTRDACRECNAVRSAFGAISSALAKLATSA